MPADDNAPTEELLDGRYRLGECVGSGGAAIVHRAEDVTLGRTVAVKIMRAGTDGPDAGARTRREMAALAALDHPGLVTLLDAKIVPGGPEYLVMEFVDGPSLRDRLDEGRLTPREVSDVARDLAEALRAAHDAGVVHRDVKPSNVLLAPTGVAAHPVQAKLADFGIAQLLDSTRLTSPGMVLGTPAYVAPEQARGAAPAPSADVFALGVVVVEMLAGRRPYSGMTPAEVVAARQTVRPPLPAGLDAGWAELLRRMTDLDPLTRPTAEEVVDALQRLGPPVAGAGTTGEDVGTDASPTRRMPTGTDSRRPARRRRMRMLAEIGASALAALVAATVWSAGAAETPAEPPVGRAVGAPGEPVAVTLPPESPAVAPAQPVVTEPRSDPGADGSAALAKMPTASSDAAKTRKPDAPSREERGRSKPAPGRSR